MIETREADETLPPRIVICGGVGTGKTTFGAMGPKPLAISPEGGIDRIRDSKGNRLKEMMLKGSRIRKWDDLREAVKKLIKEEHDYGTLILDTADFIENMCHAHILEKNGGKNIINTMGGWGAGLRESQTLHREFIHDLDTLHQQRRMAIIVTAHYAVKPVKDPEATADYDAFDLKCDERVSALWREWADAIFFVRRKISSTEMDSGKVKAHASDSLTIYSQEQAFFRAKNRYHIPAELPYTINFWNDTLVKYIAPQETWGEVIAEIDGLLAKVKEEKTRTTMMDFVNKCKDPEPNIVSLKKIRDRIKAALAKQS